MGRLQGTLFREDEADIGADDGRAHDTVLEGENGVVVGSRTSATTGKTVSATGTI